MNLMLLLEFGASLDHCKTSPEAVANCHDVLASNEVHQQRCWVYIVLLAGLCVVFRLLAGKKYQKVLSSVM
jgi:hypothetical protein